MHHPFMARVSAWGVDAYISRVYDSSRGGLAEFAYMPALVPVFVFEPSGHTTISTGWNLSNMITQSVWFGISTFEFSPITTVCPALSCL